ncbi:MAG: FCD domain-containing protein [Tepidanaerobacteraceae bacterium]|jgi:GntR family transcriptional repressor for pyruvate dehydrogenase complex|nr:FCD domain-containing protein [Tepidanaerobacteraceae bacterium]
MNEQRKNLIKKIYNALKNGEISKGNQLLPERELAKKFNVTRSALREGLIYLEALGIIEIRERQGIFIGEGRLEYITEGLENLSSSSPVDILSQVFEVRLMIETPAAELAAQRRTDHDIILLKEELDFFHYLNTTNHKDKSLLSTQHNAILHNLIVAAAHNTVLQRIYEGISRLSQNAFTALGNSYLDFHPYIRWPDVLFKEHKNLVDAIIEGNPDKAKAMSILHLERSKLRDQEAIRSSQFFLKNNTSSI